jgi:septal ring factor EnvC (AmiA/AmiB activator)
LPFIFIAIFNKKNLERDRICNDLATLQEEISIKEQLVIQLEQSEARLAQVRREYERKLAELSQRISSTESERDRILADISAKSTNSKVSDRKMPARTRQRMSPGLIFPILFSLFQAGRVL